MKKSNWMFYGIALIASMILLAVWFLLGFNHVDAPVDYALTVIWWIMIGSGCLIINHVSKNHSKKEREA